MSTQKTGKYGLALSAHPEITIGCAGTVINSGEEQHEIKPQLIKVDIGDEYVDLETMVECYLKHRPE